MATVKEDPNSPWPTYFLMGAGALLIISAFLREGGLDAIAMIKIAAGAGSFIYGIWKLTKGRKTS